MNLHLCCWCNFRHSPTLRDWAVSQLSKESITRMLLHHVDFSGIWLKQNTLCILYTLVWKETPAALAARTLFGSEWFPEFSWQTSEKIQHPMPKFWFRHDIYRFPDYCTKVWSNPGSLEYPSRPRQKLWCLTGNSPLLPATCWLLLHVIGDGLMLSLEAWHVFQNLLLFSFAL